MNYYSTRDKKIRRSGLDAVLDGLAPDGGLYVPEEFPKFDFELWKDYTYQDIGAEIFFSFFPKLTYEKAKKIAYQAYDFKFRNSEICPLHFVEEDLAFLELWHGSTLAFKDLALSALPYFMLEAKKRQKLDKKILILTATSGDTGKAAMEAFAGIKDINVLVLYPYNKVSPMQKRQMLRQKESNVRALAFDGDFDDCQRAVKEIFSDKLYQEILNEKGIKTAAANSINIGRLIPQIVYYISSYLSFYNKGRIEYGDLLNVSVPTGNFGDVLAAYYAKKMGLPLGKLIVASNSNKVLADFGSGDIYNANRPLILTSSPSMDILISSNLERYIYHESQDDNLTRKLMMDRDRDRIFSYKNHNKDMVWGWADEEECAFAIKEIYEKYKYLIDPHTATAYSVAKKQKISGPMMVLSTASPYKFPQSVFKALSIENRTSDYDSIYKIKDLSGFDPSPLLDLFQIDEKEEKVIKKKDLRQILLEFSNNNEAI